MFAYIHGNLDRQSKGLVLLSTLLEEEFALLVARDTDGIMAVEFSIHELLRQLAVERLTLRDLLDGVRVRDYMTMLPEEDGAAIGALLTVIDTFEQQCARQASGNAELSLALMDQSQEMLDFLHRRIVPPEPVTYGRKGGMNGQRSEAALIRGRL